MRTYEEILTYINKIPAMPNYIPSLDKIRPAIHEAFPDLTNYQDKMIVIAGTNGKGSVAASLDVLIRGRGHTSCLFTSPHLVRIEERFKINGKDISEENFLLHFLRIKPLADKYSLSHFEILCLLALSYFEEQIRNGAYCIWEVGMGGRWDATNAIPHLYSVITTIGHDHQKYLGNDLGEIAKNKFDIIAPHTIAISGFLPKQTYSLLEKTSANMKAELFRLDQDERWLNQFKRVTGDLYCKIQFENETFSLSLAGERGFENSLLSLYVFEKLGFKTDKNDLANLAHVRWPHRFSLFLNKPCPVYLSGDHNPEGIQSLCKILARLNYNKLWILTAITEGRDTNEIFSPLARQKNAELILSMTPFKPVSLNSYKQTWRDFSIYKPVMFEEPADAFSYALNQARPDDVIVVTGSLYLTGKIEEHFSSKL